MKPKYPRNADGDALRRVAKFGNDMSRPMEIDFFVLVPDMSAGRKVAKAASKAGYLTELVQDEEDGSITCDCTRLMLATYEGVILAQAELHELSTPFGGTMDGWGTFGNVDEGS